jgi:hypothetical protein
MENGSTYSDIGFSNIAWSCAHLQWQNPKFWNFILTDLQRRIESGNVNQSAAVITLTAFSKVKYEPASNVIVFFLSSTFTVIHHGFKSSYWSFLKHCFLQKCSH